VVRTVDDRERRPRQEFGVAAAVRHRDDRVLGAVHDVGRAGVPGGRAVHVEPVADVRDERRPEHHPAEVEPPLLARRGEGLPLDRVVHGDVVDHDAGW